MLAVSAQCGCCHHSVFHFMPYLFGTFWLYYYMVILLQYYNITWFCLHFFFFLILHGVCVVRIMGYAIGGGSYSSVYVPPPFYVFPMVLMLHIPLFFSFLCSVYSFLFHCYPYVFFFQFVCFFHAWMKTFGGCGCMCIICSPINVFWNGYTLNIFCYSCYHWPG